MPFESDAGKAEQNRRKHGVTFSQAEAVFESPAFFEDHDHSEAEDRYIAIGFDAKGRLLSVAFTYRGEDTIRIISARKASPSDAEKYAQAQRQRAADRDSGQYEVGP